MNDKRLKWIALFIVITVSALTAFWRLDSRALGNHEAYVAVTARGMTESGNWLVPYFNGQPRLQKTPLPYWLVATAAKSAGTMNDFIVRLPNAILSVLSVIAIFYFVSDWLGTRIAVISSLVWSTSLCYFRFSHTGRPEMTLAVFVAIAMLSFYSAEQAATRKKQICCILVFWLSFSLAMLAKGPAPLPLIFPALFFYFAVFRKWKLIGKLLPITGTILFLLIILPWPIAVLMKFPAAEQIWRNEFFGRAAGEYASGSKPFYYYFGVMFTYLLPFSAFIPPALAAPFYRVWEKKQDSMLYLWLWFVVGIVVMSLCGGKRQHYILPVMPAMAILTGIIMDDMIFARKAYSKRFALNFLIGHLIVLFVGVCVFIFVRPTISVTKDAEDDSNYVIMDFAHQVGSEAADKSVIAYCKVNPSFIYYFKHNVPVVCDINEIYVRYCAGNGVIASGDNFEQLKNDGRFKLSACGLDKGRGFFVMNKNNE